MTVRIRRLRAAEVVLAATVSVMVYGYFTTSFAQGMSILSQPQDAINATLIERQNALADRLGKIETLLQYGMVGLVGNLIAHLFQIKQTSKRQG